MKINGETHYLWRAVDHEGEVLESFVTKRRDRKAALKFIRKSMKRYGNRSICDRQTAILRRRDEGHRQCDKQETGRWLNNRAENSHLPFRRRERAMLRFSACEVYRNSSPFIASVHNHFNQERHLYSRDQFQAQPHRRSCRVASARRGIRISLTVLVETGSNWSDTTRQRDTVGGRIEGHGRAAAHQSLPASLARIIHEACFT